jgi:hypothetical protein
MSDKKRVAKTMAGPKRRNAEAVLAWQRGRRVEPSAKAYRRKAKHQKPRSQSGAFDIAGLSTLGAPKRLRCVLAII